MNNTKVCTKCKETKNIKYFSYRTDTKKFRDQCKKCNKGYKNDLADIQNEIQNLLYQGLKKCGKCKDIKSLELFNLDKYTVSGKTSYCKECVKKKYSKEEVKNSNYKRKYNITIDDYNFKYNSLDGKCEICQIKYPLLSVDHNHNTGEVRGLLCTKCNTSIGFMKENIDILNNAIKYLKYYNKL